MDFRFSFIGFVIGFLIGMTGMGGGSLMTPVMILIMGVQPTVAVGTDLAYAAITKVVGGVVHSRQATVHRRTAFLLAAGSVPAAILGVAVTAHLKKTDPDFVNQFLTRSLAFVLVSVGILLFVKPAIAALMSRLQRGRPEAARGLGERRPWILPILGAIVGFLVGLTSVGSGTLIVVGLLFLYPSWDSKDVVGTDVFHAAMLAVAASLAQGVAGNVNIAIMGALLLGSIPGVFLGSRMAVNIPERVLRLSMASVLLLSGAKLL